MSSGALQRLQSGQCRLKIVGLQRLTHHSTRQGTGLVAHVKLLSWGRAHTRKCETIFVNPWSNLLPHGSAQA